MGTPPPPSPLRFVPWQAILSREDCSPFFPCRLAPFVIHNNVINIVIKKDREINRKSSSSVRLGFFWRVKKKEPTQRNTTQRPLGCHQTRWGKTAFVCHNGVRHRVARGRPYLRRVEPHTHSQFARFLQDVRRHFHALLSLQPQSIPGCTSGWRKRGLFP